MESFISFQDFLVSLVDNKKELQNSFDSLVLHISEKYGVKPVRSDINIEETKKKFPINDIYSFGVQREVKNDTLIIIISSIYENLLPFILLREVYYSFLPEEALEFRAIKISINHIIEINLEDHPLIDKWKPLIRKHSVDKEYRVKYERMGKFFRANAEGAEGPIEFFFKYVRQNLKILDDEKDLYDELFSEYMFKTSRNLYNDDIVETIRILIKIFYRIKIFTSLSEYCDLFSELKKEGFIHTDLSLRKFQKNLRWLKKYSYIAPNYTVNLGKIDMKPYTLLIQFHPYISKSKLKVNRFLEQFPFLRYKRMENNGFTLTLVGYIFMPKGYERDLIKFLKQMKAEAYAINIKLFNLVDSENNLNLNYFREFQDRKLIINRNHPEYEKKYEITQTRDYTISEEIYSPSLIEFLILDRVRYYSITGFGFEREREVLNILKSDFLNDLLSQASTIKKLRKYLTLLHKKKPSTNKLSNMLNLFSSSGIFFIKETVDSIIEQSKFIKDFTEKNNINTQYEFKKFVQQKEIDLYTELLNNDQVKQLFIEKLLPLFFKNRQKYKKTIRIHSFFSELLDIFFELKIFNINIIKRIIEDEDLISTLFIGKQDKLKSIHKKYKVEDITIKKIRNILDKLLEGDPPTIQPSLISTISTTVFAGYNLFLTLKNTPNIKEQIDNIKFLFPRTLVVMGSDLIANENLIYLDIFLPKISLPDKKTLFSLLQSTFGKDLYNAFRLNTHGIINTFSLKDFYDFENNQYFYTKDIFSQFLLYMYKLFNSPSQSFFLRNKRNQFNVFPSDKKQDFDSLANITLKRNSRKQLDFTHHNVQQLEEFHKNLETNLQNLTKYRELTKTDFFNNYIHSIKFIPNFHQFGFSKYLLWFKTHDLSSIRLKSLLTNTFLTIKTPAENNSLTSSILISYLFPFRTPNTSYVNWLHKTKHQFIEYFLIRLTKMVQIIHFNRNLTKKGWDLKAENFITFAKKLLLGNSYEVDHSIIKRYSLETTSDIIYGPNTVEFKALKDLYTYKTIDLKSFLARQNYSKLDSFKLLHSKELLFPYLELKNLGFKEIVHIFIPNLKSKNISNIVDVFSFFNYCSLFEVEGDYFIEGMYDKSSCREGLYIKLYLPDCAIHEFYNAFYEIFTLLGIEEYAIFHDLVDGAQLLKNVYGDLEFLSDYTPLTNLKWNKKDKIWMNVKILDEKFNFLPINL